MDSIRKADPLEAALSSSAPATPITASIMVDDGGERPAYCLMAAFRKESDARAALAAILSQQAASPAPSDVDRAEILAALVLAEDVLSRRPNSDRMWFPTAHPEGMHPFSGIEQIRAAIVKARAAFSHSAPSSPPPAPTEGVKAASEAPSDARLDEIFMQWNSHCFGDPMSAHRRFARLVLAAASPEPAQPAQPCARTLADQHHLEQDALLWRTLRDLCGYLGDGSSDTVTLSQDDATRSCFIKVGGKRFGTDRSTFEGILLEIANESKA